MITRYIPGLRALQNMVNNSTDSTISMLLIVTAFLLLFAALKLPPAAKGVILGWVIFP